jgi:hypothetical protein
LECEAAVTHDEPINICVERHKAEIEKSGFPAVHNCVVYGKVARDASWGRRRSGGGIFSQENWIADRRERQEAGEHEKGGKCIGEERGGIGWSSARFVPHEIEKSNPTELILVEWHSKSAFKLQK